jgi:hypothetical protein
MDNTGCVIYRKWNHPLDFSELFTHSQLHTENNSDITIYGDVSGN